MYSIIMSLRGLAKWGFLKPQTHGHGTLRDRVYLYIMW